MQKEIQALRGKYLFGKNAHDLCLVSNVKIPTKFKVPYFEKYKGNSCPLSHLVMCARKMLTETDNHQLLIHYFQDCLIDAALKWYMGFDSTQIQTFNDLEGGLSDSSRRYVNGFPKKKEHDANSISQEKRRRSPRNSQRYQHVASVALSINPAIVVQVAPSYQPCFPQRTNQQNQQHQQNRVQRPAQFNPIPMSYTKLFPALIQKNLVETRTSPTVPKELSWWYKPNHHCAFHQGAPDHDVENCFTLKDEVRRLMQSGILYFEDSGPNVQANLLPKHYGEIVNMVEGCPGKYLVYDVNLIRRSLVEMHATLCEFNYYEYDHASGHISSRNPRGYDVVKIDLQEMLDQNLIQIRRDRDQDEHEVNVIVPRFNIPEPVVIELNGQKSIVSSFVIFLAGPTPYESAKVVPYKYNATMLEDGKEVSIPYFSSIVNITYVSGVTRSGRVFAAATPKRTEDVVIEKLAQEKTPVIQSDQSSSVNQSSDQDEVLKLIRKSGLNVVDQLLHTPSKIYVLSLLKSLEAHKEVLHKVMEPAYMDHDVTIGQFGGIMANITACNNLSFSDEELLEQGRNHNLALHISMNCQEDAMSNVMVETGSSMNVLPKATISKLYYQGALMLVGLL
ncbi:uncharacterized protein LOC127103370 [Lathyrus oleraceus]|uniref:uncharacterized protein LOC127103370 n=1 Tax=Pisum sativum TaxID=3888 RepID=UPI0021CE17F5|nr:uncharacterized protein LOC127103370 [Pisum sativum]